MQGSGTWYGAYCDIPQCERKSAVGAVGIDGNGVYHHHYCNHHHIQMKKGLWMKATHIRLKNKAKVYVERFEGGVLVVRNMKGKVLGSYERKDMAKFSKRYRSLIAKKQTA